MLKMQEIVETEASRMIYSYGRLCLKLCLLFSFAIFCVKLSPVILSWSFGSIMSELFEAFKLSMAGAFVLIVVWASFSVFVRHISK